MEEKTEIEQGFNNIIKPKNQYFSSKNITMLAVLLAIVILLQATGGAIKIGTTSFSLVLIPIVLGAVLIGPVAGVILGFAFGFIVLMYGITGADPFTSILFTDHPIITSLLCLGKGALAGLISGLAYKFIVKKNKYVAIFTASAIAPIVNTGLFILGALFMSDTLNANFITDGSTVIYYLVIGCAGVNFIIEFFVNLVLSPALFRVVNIVEKNILNRG